MRYAEQSTGQPELSWQGEVGRVESEMVVTGYDTDVTTLGDKPALFHTIVNFTAHSSFDATYF